MFRCTADVKGCRALYTNLTDPDAQTLKWREVMLKVAPPKQIYVQGNTFVSKDGDSAILKEYKATVEGVIQSWAERDLYLE